MTGDDRTIVGITGFSGPAYRVSTGQWLVKARQKARNLDCVSRRSPSNLALSGSTG